MTLICKISTIKQALGHYLTILLKILFEGTVSHKAMELIKALCIFSYFQGKKFLRAELFLAFQGEIFTNCHGLLRTPIEKQTFRG